MESYNAHAEDTTVSGAAIIDSRKSRRLQSVRTGFMAALQSSLQRVSYQEYTRSRELASERFRL